MFILHRYEGVVLGVSSRTMLTGDDRTTWWDGWWKKIFFAMSIGLIGKDQSSNMSYGKEKRMNNLSRLHVGTSIHHINGYLREKVLELIYLFWDERWYLLLGQG